MADPVEPRSREERLLGRSRVLGARPVQEAVENFGQTINKLSKSLGRTLTQIEAANRLLGGGNKNSSLLGGNRWNANSHWGGWGGAVNGGAYRINGQARALGLTGAGDLKGLGTVGMPASRETYDIHTRQQVPAPNGGGATFGGRPYGGFGKGVVAAAVGRAAFGGAAAGMTAWGDRMFAGNMQSDIVGTFAANAGYMNGASGRAAQALTMGRSTANSSADLLSAQMTALTTGGSRAFSTGGFRESMGIGGILNPMMSEAQRAVAQQGIGSAQMHNTLRMYGIATTGPRGQRDQVSVNADIARRFGLNRAMNRDQIRSTFFNQNSGINQTLRSLGMSPDQISMFQNQAAQESRIMARGGDVNKFRRLATQAAGQGDRAQRASTRLEKEFNYDTTALQDVRQQNASRRDRDLETMEGWQKGIKASTDLVGDFNQALQKILRGPLGNAAGFGAASLGNLGSWQGIGAGAAGLATSALHIAGGVGLYRGARRLLGRGAGAAGAGAGRGAGALAKLGRFAKVGGKAAGIAGVAMMAADEIINPRDHWNKGWEIGHGRMSAGEVGKSDWTDWASPGVAIGAIAGLGHQIGTIASTGTIDPEGHGAPPGGNGPSGRSPGGLGNSQGGATSASVVSKAADMARNGTYLGVGKCQTFARSTAGSPGGAGSAAVAWQQAKYKHTKGIPPAGAFVFWLGGPHGYGHVAVSAGGGKCYSTDVFRRGRVDLVDIDWINQHWRNLRYVGWTEDNNGIRVKMGKVGAATSSGASDGTEDPSTPSGRPADAANVAAAGMTSYGSIEEGAAITAALGGSGGSTLGGGAATASTGGQEAREAAGGKGTSGGAGAAPTALKKNAQIVKKAAARRGWTGSQWDALYQLVQHESGFNNNARNPKSTAYGMFQFLDSTWSSYGQKTADPAGQTDAGLKYIAQKYKSPAGAWSFWQKNNWYEKGAWDISDDQTARVHRGEMIIPARQASTIRDALLKEAVPSAPQTGGRSGGKISLQFHAGSVVIKVDGAGDDASMRKAAEKFVGYLSEDERLKTMGEGR